MQNDQLTTDQKDCIQAILDTHTDEELCDLFFPGIFDAITHKADRVIAKGLPEEGPYQFKQDFPDIA